jgi:hypothetical protein
MYSKITITLKPKEKAALIALAEHEERDPRGQASILIRESLNRRGLLSPYPEVFQDFQAPFSKGKGNGSSA